MKFISLITCIIPLFSMQAIQNPSKNELTDIYSKNLTICYAAMIWYGHDGNMYACFDGKYVQIDEWHFIDLQEFPWD